MLSRKIWVVFCIHRFPVIKISKLIFRLILSFRHLARCPRSRFFKYPNIVGKINEILPVVFSCPFNRNRKQYLKESSNICRLQSVQNRTIDTSILSYPMIETVYETVNVITSMKSQRGAAAVAMAQVVLI